jgi:hypothetical protein
MVERGGREMEGWLRGEAGRGRMVERGGREMEG